MPKVNFYLLKQQDEQSRRVFACRLAEKLWRQGHAVQLYTDSEAEAREVDQLLWSFADDSFVPHALHTNGMQPGSVTVSWAQNHSAGGNLLNLSSSQPASCNQYATIAEFVLNEEQALLLSRQLWAQYKQAGCELHHHKI